MLSIIKIEQHDRIKLKSWEELQALNPIEDFIQPYKKYIGKSLYVLRTVMYRDMQYTYAAVKADGKAIKRIPDCYIATVNGAIPERITLPEVYKIEHPDGTTTEIPNSELPTISKEVNTNFVPIEPRCPKEDQCNNCHAFDDIEIRSFNLHSPHFTHGMFKDKVEVNINVKLTKEQFIALVNKLDNI